MIALPKPERKLATQDAVLRQVILSQRERWPHRPTEDPIWGLVRMVLAQQISTAGAHRVAERVLGAYPELKAPSPTHVPDVQVLRSFGIPATRASCCAEVVRRSTEIRSKITAGLSWEQVVGEIKGVGPWTVAVFRILVLRHPDVLPLGDAGLVRAVRKIYGTSASVTGVSDRWHPYRSVACWYLWRTLGNLPLG